MKRLLSYTILMVLTSMITSSCILDKMEHGGKPLQTSLEIALNFPDSSDDFSKAGSNTEPDYTQESDYENTIPSEKEIRLFLFDNETGKFVVEITDKTIDFKPSETVKKKVVGTIPAGLVGKNVKLVFMANYDVRMPKGKKLRPKVGQTYKDWASTTYFVYSTPESATSKAEKFLIPMSGQVDFTIQEEHNSVGLFLTRALSKVSIAIDPKSGYAIKEIMVQGTTSAAYCIKNYLNDNPLPEYLKVPDAQIQNQYGGGNRFFNDPILPGQSIKFYVSEQTRQHMTMSFILYNVNDPNDNSKQSVDFKYYPKGEEYPVERNYLYVFNINKKQAEDSKVDITTSIEPWKIVDINTNFE